MRTGFVFQRVSGIQQRRFFVGRFLRRSSSDPICCLRFPTSPVCASKALHGDDAADAYWRAVTCDVHGAFNVAAEQAIDSGELAAHWDAHTLPVPGQAVRAAVATGWRLHATPSSPYLFDTATRLPLMDTRRARSELGWLPRHSALDAVDAFCAGIRDRAGFPTPPLAVSRLPFSGSG